MKSSIDVKLLIAALMVMLMAIRSSDAVVDCTTESVENCISQSKITQLQMDYADIFCTQGPLRIKQIYECIATLSCQLSSDNNQYLVQIVSTIDSYCAAKDSRCANIAQRYLNFTNCYTIYGGLDAILDGVAYSFNVNNPAQLYDYCKRLAWGRTCELQLADDCPYLTALQSAGVEIEYRSTAAFYVCGAESGLFVYNDTSFCSARDIIVATVNDRCAVTCDVISARSNDDVCRIMQSQIECIMAYTAGCTPIGSQFVVPRLASYWAVNELLGCHVQIKGFQVWARANQCSINSLLTACFNLTISSFRTLDAVKNLLTMQFPLSQICNLYQKLGISIATLTKQCAVAMTSCVIPLGQVYNWPALNDPQSVYSTTEYNPALGPFTVNAWGLDYLSSNLQPSLCLATGHVQCATTPAPLAISTSTFTPAN